MKRRKFLQLAAASAALSVSPRLARSQSYPTHPVRLIVGFPAGGQVDIVARLTAQWLGERLGQSVVVEDKPGAGGNLGAQAVVNAAPDGYTLIYSSASGLVIAPLLHPDPGYDPLKSYDPIALVGESSNILVVNPSVPANTVQELVAYASANPGKVNFSSGGVGVLPHLIGEMFKARADIDIVHVPYKGGGPSINDVVAGNVQMTFEGTSVLLPLIKAGRLRALAVTTGKRIPQLPDVPTLVESGFPDFVSTSWTGLLAPAHTPQAIIAKLNRTINEGLKTPELKTALERLSNEPLGGTAEDFTVKINADLAKWSPIIKSLGLDKQ